MTEPETRRKYIAITSRMPEHVSNVEACCAAALKSGPLDEKTAFLIRLAASIVQGYKDQIMESILKCRDAGASFDELRHAAIQLTHIVGFPPVAEALGHIDEFEQRPIKKITVGRGRCAICD